MLCNKRSHHNGKPVHRNKRVAFTLHNWRKSLCSNEDPAQPKITINKLKNLKRFLVTIAFVRESKHFSFYPCPLSSLLCCFWLVQWISLNFCFPQLLRGQAHDYAFQQWLHTWASQWWGWKELWYPGCLPKLSSTFRKIFLHHFLLRCSNNKDAHM